MESWIGPGGESPPRPLSLPPRTSDVTSYDGIEGYHVSTPHGRIFNDRAKYTNARVIVGFGSNPFRSLFKCFYLWLTRRGRPTKSPSKAMTSPEAATVSPKRDGTKSQIPKEGRSTRRVKPHQSSSGTSRPGKSITGLGCPALASSSPTAANRLRSCTTKVHFHPISTISAISTNDADALGRVEARRSNCSRGLPTPSAARESGSGPPEAQPENGRPDSDMLFWGG